MKKSLCSIVCIIILIGNVMPVFALPNSIWRVLSDFEQAMNNGNDTVMLQKGEQIIEIMKSQPDSSEKTSFLAGKYEQISRCAERLGNYDRAVQLYKEYLPYGEAMGWTDGIIFAKRKIVALQSFFDVYFETNDTNSLYYGAKFEPRVGTYFGAAYDNDPRIGTYNSELIRKHFPKNESTYLMYLEFGDDIEKLERYSRYFADAKRNNKAVVLAWNTYSNIDPNNYEEYIKRTIDYLGNSGLNIFLRFGGEMNIGPSGEDADGYKRAFAYISSYAKTKQNIAIVWSPSELGALNRPFDMYYPGDEFVDWIGVSAYTMPYFQGKPDHGSNTDALNTYFFTGEYSNPLIRIRPIIDFMKSNNINKPLMFSECGVSSYVNTTNEDMTDWATVQMKRMYGQLQRLYPQLKMINYFDVYMPNEDNVYALYKNQKMNDLYNKLVDNDYFISDFGKSAKYSYAPLQNNITINEPLKLSAVAYYPKTLYNEVCYFIDGNMVSSTYDSPFEYTLNPSSLGGGNHALSVLLKDNGKVLFEKSYNIMVEQNIKVIYNNKEVIFPDQKPLLINDRTLVPARGVFEAMGATVAWDGEKESVDIIKGNIKIKLYINKNELIIDKLGRVTTEIMDVPAQLINGRTMLPLRAISQAIGAKVDWIEQSSTAKITL